MFESRPASPSQEFLRQSSSGREFVRQALDVAALKAWKENSDGLLHQIRNLIIPSAETADSGREKLTSVRDSFFSLLKEGKKIAHDIPAREEIEKVPEELRRALTGRLSVLREELEKVLLEFAGPDSKKDENYLLAAVKSIMDDFEFLRPGGETRPENLDIVCEAQKTLSADFEWAKQAADLELRAFCRLKDLRYILTSISESIGDTAASIISDKVCFLFNESAENPAFYSLFSSVEGQIEDLLIDRPRIICDSPSNDRLTITVCLTPDMQEAWSGCVSGLKESLKPASLLAAENNLLLSVKHIENPQSVEICLQAASPLPAGGKAPRGVQYLRSHSPYTDSLQFTTRVHCADQSSALIKVTTQRSAFMSAEAFLTMRETLDAACDFIALNKSRINRVGFSADCSITLNEDAFREGFFIVSLKGARVRDGVKNISLAPFYTLPWEDKNKDRLTFFKQWNDSPPPQGNAIHLPANALIDDDIRLNLLRFGGAFDLLDIDFGGRGDFNRLYSPPERVEIVKRSLEESAAAFLKPEYGKSFALRIEPASNGFAFKISEGGDLFKFYVYDSENAITQVGRISATDLKLYLRPHVMAHEELALARLQRALEGAEEGGDFCSCLKRAGLIMPEAGLRELGAGGGNPSIGDLTHNPIRKMQDICRNPWFNIEFENDLLVFTEAASRPSAPDLSVSYGTVGRHPIQIFRMAHELYRIQEMEKNNGYLFEPNEEFFRKLKNGGVGRLEIP